MYSLYSYNYRDIEKNVYTKTISGLESKIIGGYNSYDKQINITKHDITDIKNIIIKEIISGSDNIIVGDYAIIDANNELSENIKKTDDNKRLQMISNMNPNDVKLLIQKAIKNAACYQRLNCWKNLANPNRQLKKNSARIALTSAGRTETITMLQ